MLNDNPSHVRDLMLGWYDSHRRTLPWRSEPLWTPDSYHVWMSEIMLQQTTVAAVKSYFLKFIDLWPTVEDLAGATQDDVMREWAGLGYYSRARNLHRCAQIIVSEYGGVFPNDLKQLKNLAGIGDYTAAAIRSIAFDLPATVIDGNIERVISRLYRIETPLPSSKQEIRSYAQMLFEGNNVTRPSCFAQSLMDLGATICTPRSPKCFECPLNGHCQAYKAGDAEVYPKKEKKKKIPKKHAIAYLYIHDGKIGIERRGEKGMLAGMVGFPTSEWVDVSQDLPEAVDKKIFIHHVFTHFSFTLYPVIVGRPIDEMIAFESVDACGLPTVFKKLWTIMRDKIE